MIHYTQFDFSQLNKNTYKKRSKNGSVEWSECIIVLDTEVTSAWKDDNGNYYCFDYNKPYDYYTTRQSLSWVYIWAVSIDGIAVYGRYIDEYKQFIADLQKHIECKIVVYIQNMGYEFQVLLRNLYEEMDVFARKTRKPMKITIGEVEYRDLYIYTNQSLENLGKHNTVYKKLVGDLDYNIMRFCDTELTDKEMAYVENDVLVPYEYLKKEVEFYKHIVNLPLTQTGKVRKRLQKIYKNKPSYNKKCRTLVPKLKVYKLLKRAFQGGYTHANALYADETIENVYSWDFASSYPTVMVCEKYPYGNFLLWDDGIDDIPNNYLWIAVIKFTNIKSKYLNNYISSYHCDSLKNAVNDNGRVSSADECIITLTSVDYEIITKTYSIEKIEPLEIWVSSARYLDKDFVNFILDLYKDKTELKDVAGEEDLYMRQKESINSCYGMAVTNYVCDEISYKYGDWQAYRLCDDMAREQLNKLRESKTLLTVYAHGVFITAYARRNLWLGGIIHMDDDVIYCDTDSIKHLGEHKDIMNNYNKFITDKLRQASIENDFDFDKTHPCDKHGIEHPLGVFDDETKKGAYKEFRTMGAKRYAYRDCDGNLHCTVSGVSKKTGYKALNDNIDNFTEGLLFDYYTSGKMLSTYNDEQEIAIIDGHEIDCKYGLTLRPTTYNLTMSDTYLEYIAEQKNNFEIENEKEWLYNDNERNFND